jgi:hypothetical protein
MQHFYQKDKRAHPRNFLNLSYSFLPPPPRRTQEFTTIYCCCWSYSKLETRPLVREGATK